MLESAFIQEIRGYDRSILYGEMDPFGRIVLCSGLVRGAVAIREYNREHWVFNDLRVRECFWDHLGYGFYLSLEWLAYGYVVLCKCYGSGQDDSRLLYEGLVLWTFTQCYIAIAFWLIDRMDMFDVDE